MDTLGTIILLLVLMVSGIKSENEFRVVSSCGCELVVECTVTGGVATIWQGTILDGCQNDEITLRHTQFNTGTVFNQSCGTMPPIVGRSISAADGSFTSQLIVTLCNNSIIGTIIECANQSGYNIIGSHKIDTSSIPAINISVLPPKSIPGEVIIAWDLVYENDTLNQNVTQVYDTSNCGMCMTASSNFATCNLTESNLQVDTPVCNVTVMIEIIECNSVITEQYSVDLNDLVYATHNDTMTTANLTKQVATRNWSICTPLLYNEPQKVFLVAIPLASIGLLLMLLVLAMIFVVAIVKYKSQHKKQMIGGISDHSDNPVHVDVEGDNMMQYLGQYSLLQYPSNNEGLMTYLEIGPNTRVRTEVLPSADSVEYAEVNHRKSTKPQISIDKYLNLDTLLIQVRYQVTPLWHEFGVAAGVPMDTLNKCFNYTPEESIVEVLDYWLRQGGKTWRDVAGVLNEIHLQDLAKKILKVYDTGLLPTTVVDEDIMVPAITSGGIGEVTSETHDQSQPSPPPLPPKPY